MQTTHFSDAERDIKEQFEATLARLAKTRLTGVSQETRAKLEKPKKSRNAKNGNATGALMHA